MSLLTDPSSIFSDQGGAVLGGMTGLNHTHDTFMAGLGNRVMALGRANQWQNDARKEMAKNKVPPSAAPNPMNGLISAGAQAFKGILGAGAPGSNANSGYDVGNELWQGFGQEFGSFGSGADLSGGVGSSLGSSWGDSFSADNFLGGW